MGYARTVIEDSKQKRKRFVRYEEGAQLYSLGVSKFTQIAKEAKATYRIDKVVLVNCDILDRYLEGFRVEE